MISIDSSSIAEPHVRRRPRVAEDVLVERLAGADAEPEAAVEEHLRRRRGLGDHGGVDAQRRAGHAGGHVHARHVGRQRPDHRPHERALALRVVPRVVVVGDPQPLQARGLRETRLIEQLTGRELLAGEEAADAHTPSATPRLRPRLLGSMAGLDERTRWEPAEAERAIFERWLESGLFAPEPDGTADENYSIAIPPPNVTGALHMGHALNGSVQDALIRYNRMLGRRVRWILGTDHAGIATQTQVERLIKREGTTRQELGREAFIERVWQWREEYGGIIFKQFQRLGASCDYEHERFTLDEQYVRAVMKVFVDLHRKGLIYRDNRIVNWDPGSRSAISDLEVEEREVSDTLYHVDYPLASGGGSITVATVRPETMLADTAIAVHPDDERYTRLVGETAILPIVGRRLRIIADPYVKPEFGTGALKITPGHDPNDFEIGRAHGLEEITVIGEDGRMNEQAGEAFAGMTPLEAREAVVAALRDQGALARTEPYTHAVPFSHRSGERIEPLISLQWFMKMEELAAPAIQAVHDGDAAHPPGQPAPPLPRVAGEHPALVHLAPALVGPPDPRLVPRRGDLRRHRAPGGRRLGARPGRARHVVLVGPVAVRHARLARRHAGAARLLPDRRALHGPRHPLPLGGADGDARHRVHRRAAVRRRLQPLDDPRPGRPAHVQVAGHRHRPARRDRPARRRRHALRAARDVLHAGRALLRGEGRAGPPARQQALQRQPAGPAARRRRRRLRRGRRARAADGRGPLDPLPARAHARRDGEGDRDVRVPPRRARPLRLRLRASSATGTWRSSSRACTRTTTPRSPASRCTCSPRRSRSPTR